MSEMNFGALVQQAKAAGSFTDLLPEGDGFLLEIVRGRGDHKEGKAPRIGLQFEVVESEYEPDDVGRKGWVNLYFSERAAPISVRQLGDLGLPDDFLANSSSIEQVAEALVGTQVRGDITIRTWGKDGDRHDNVVKVTEVVIPPAVVDGPVDPSEADEDEVDPF